MFLSQLHRSFVKTLSLAFAFLFVTSFVYGDDLIVPPSGGQDVLSFSEDGKVEFRNENIEATSGWVPAKNMPFQKAYQVSSEVRFSKPTNMRVIVPISEAFKKGDVVLMSFWMRRPGAGGQPNNAVFYFQPGKDLKGFEYKLSAYKEWKQHVRSFVATADYDPEISAVDIHLGEAGRTAEIADFRLINYGADYDIDSLPRSTVNYPGREPEAQWRKDALARIEKIRKADLTIEVVGSDGQPIPNATVKAQMQRHAFGFGNAVNAELLGGEQQSFPYTRKRSGTDVTSSWQDAQRYRQVVKDYFNCVTFESELRPHVWKKQISGSPEGKRLNRVLLDQAVPWLQANGIGIRGHYVAWAPMDFNAIEKDFVGDPTAHRQWLWDHMSDVLPKTAEFVTEWDTINHIVGWGKHTYEKEYGGLQIYADIMAESRRLAPDATHAINEGKVLPDGYKRKDYKRIIRFLNDQGQAPDVVGFMGHFGLTTLTPPEELLEVYDNFAEIAPRLQLSEFDVDAGDDDQLQADYFRDVMIASFSHPNFQAIIQWGFWEKAHWKRAAALWREDWTLKPSGQVFTDLVKNQWWTNETVTTDEAGQSKLRGFLGQYNVTAEHEGQTITKPIVLNREGATIQIQLQ
ncbi:Endo-1,4-beta-xylanase Z precursor [Rubripirellula obstinata]|uniref:endo-1,4-beta-xylanase n=1 Tax=Rubripirellula obstinata TaxID=406547 RepID=A0A5B1CF89_9BACT|nr:endo-1,4-beta-xylanase [Rubripirellula obstinata]KAA1259857.1 Endo-1,4-beta-xylanase Z precursor [Rubripirellula obstinata]